MRCCNTSTKTRCRSANWFRELIQIADTIMKGLEANPADRWQTIKEMIAEFRSAEARLVTATRELLKRRGVDPDADESTEAKGSDDGDNDGASPDFDFDDLISSEIAAASKGKKSGRKKRRKNASAKGPQKTTSNSEPTDGDKPKPPESAETSAAKTSPEAAEEQDDEEEPLSLD